MSSFSRNAREWVATPFSATTPPQSKQWYDRWASIKQSKEQKRSTTHSLQGTWVPQHSLKYKQNMSRDFQIICRVFLLRYIPDVNTLYFWNRWTFNSKVPHTVSTMVFGIRELYFWSHWIFNYQNLSYIYIAIGYLLIITFTKFLPETNFKFIFTPMIRYFKTLISNLLQIFLVQPHFL